ncbi:DUF4874 domain-containing protein [Streptomyces sp. NPDC048172]|uniref:DUF4874 domain-containing protein n=1 Tax=Streptomyces sp. NPDC048172 TaxID=3365505 RepID=UPI0037212C76
MPDTSLTRRGVLLTGTGAAAGAVLVPGPAAALARERLVRVPQRGIRAADPGGEDGLANPHRGFRYEMSYNAKDLTSPWPIEADHPADADRTLDILRRKYGAGAHVTQLYFYLYDYATGALPDTALDHMRHVFEGLRARNCTAVLRFAYDDGVRPALGYGVRDIERHLDRLAPLVARNSDVVSVWQAGFLGNWGEWSHDLNDDPAAVTAVARALTDALPDGVRTQLRYGELRERVTDDRVRAAIGFHNDYVTLGGGKWDYYVPGNPYWRDYLDVSATLPMDGEMPWDKGQSEDPYAWDTVIDPVACARRLQTLRWDTLSLVHNATVTLPAWKAGALSERQVRDAGLPVSDGYFEGRGGTSVPRTPFAYLRDHLGYRPELREVRHAARPDGDGRLLVEADVVNRGFAPPKHPRPVRFVLLDRSGEVLSTADTGADWRDWSPSGRAEEGGGTAPVRTVRGVLRIPRGVRSGRLGLALPAPHSGRPSLAVRCANATVRWEHGVNVLAPVRW